MTITGAALQAERHGDHVVVRVSGELDVFNAAEVMVQIETAVPAEAHVAIVDLTAVGFLDSTAIRKLFALAARLGERRQGLRVVAPAGSMVLRTLELVDFARSAPMHETVAAALADLR